MIKQLQGHSFTGTSNIVVFGTKQNFPEALKQKSRLHYYSRLFNSLEVNSSFYKVPMLTTFEKRGDGGTGGFSFHLKNMA